jgi:formiminoglutamase
VHTPLPVLISIPHGGLAIPDRLKSQFLPDSRSVLRDADTWARELYSLHGEVAAIINTDIARLVLDMNRSPQDRPPGNPDGVVKTVTVVGERVWRNPDGLSSQEVNCMF